MSADVRVLVKHSAECDEQGAECDEQGAEYGWPDRWMAEWREPTWECRDRIGRRHRHGELWEIWRCSDLMACPAKAVVRRAGVRVAISRLIEESEGA